MTARRNNPNGESDSWRAWWRRVRGLSRKETIQIVRDPSSYLIAGLMPLVLLFIFGYGVSLDLRQVPVAVVIENATPEANSLLRSFSNSRYFIVEQAASRQQPEEDLLAGRVKGVIVLASDFSDRLGRGDSAPVQILVDGSDPNTAGLVLNYAQGVWSNWLLQEAFAQGDLVPRDHLQPIVYLEPRYWFNPEARSQNFLIPGSVAIIMTLIGTLLTALVIAREWERGTIEALMTTPVGVSEFLLGKLIPYFLLGMGAMSLAATAAVWIFDVPFRGSIPMLLAVTALFLLTMLPQGLLISTVTRNQFVASQAALIAAFLPAFELSGFIFEISSMPPAIRMLTYFLPARYYVTSLQTLFLAGDVMAVLLPAMATLATIAVILLSLLVYKTRMSLE
ncbi:MAG TPA: ABC transporter permease [Pirellulales bacterium]|jgi:ABC-2 type transport system permease protein|nr:ABC transporter permease [Pirellulales bacterium]